MALVDKLAVEKYNLQIKQMMENAGRNMARFVMDKFHPKRVLVLFGKGNNGGDGVAAARHLIMYGVKVDLISASPLNQVNKETKHQLSILKKAGIKPKKKASGKYDVIIDSLLGYNIKGNPRGKYAELINLANDLNKKHKSIIVSFDIPSGMNPNSGKCYKPCIDSDYVLTLALPKKGMKNLKNVYLGSLGIPNHLYESIGIKVRNIFEKDDVVKVS